jgi:large subunit ribosomal protein L3
LKGILGKKLGMSQIYAADGRVVPVTVLQAGPCVVVQRKKSSGKDGYDAVQLGLVETKGPRKVTQPRRGHFQKAGVDPVRRLAEFQLGEAEDLKPGDRVQVSIFQVDDYVDIVGTSKGKGFQGVIKRHGFAGGRASHGSMFHRAPGSIGSSAWPSRVFPGLRAAGHQGDARVTVKNLKVVRVVEADNLLFVRGAVPGGRNSYVQIRKARRGGKS